VVEGDASSNRVDRGGGRETGERKKKRRKERERERERGGVDGRKRGGMQLVVGARTSCSQRWFELWRRKLVESLHHINVVAERILPVFSYRVNVRLHPVTPITHPGLQRFDKI
jgi:hypothetical protein